MWHTSLGHPVEFNQADDDFESPKVFPIYASDVQPSVAELITMVSFHETLAESLNLDYWLDGRYEYIWYMCCIIWA